MKQVLWFIVLFVIVHSFVHEAVVLQEAADDDLDSSISVVAEANVSKKIDEIERKLKNNGKRSEQPKWNPYLKGWTILYDSQSRKGYVEVTVLPKVNGTKCEPPMNGKWPTDKATKWVKEVGELGDQAGHIIARSLGGDGDIHNIFPQSAKINLGLWNKLEMRARAWLMLFENPCNHYVEYRAAFLYNNTRTQRPHCFLYEHKFFFGKKDPYDTKAGAVCNPVKGKSCSDDDCWAH